MTETTSGQGAPRSLLGFLREGRASGATGTRAQRGARKRAWGSKRIVALATVLIIPLIGILGGFGIAAAHADSSSDSMQYSFYKVASSTTAFFSAMQEPGHSGNFSGPWMTALGDPGTAGSLLGYADPDFSSVSGWLASKLSGSSDAIGYDTLLLHNAGDSSGYAGASYQGMADYAYFGAALKGMGLDSTSTGLSLGFMNWVSGGIVMLLFILGGAVDFVFNAFIGVLGTLNPFKLFYAGVAKVDPALANGMIGNGDPNAGPLNGVVSWIGGWYQLLTSLSWGVMVPLFIAVLVFSLLMFKKMDRGGAIKKLLIRVLFIGLGLPLLGSMYTGMINSMSDASSSGDSASARVVMSTYVDFENWALNSRLQVPAGATISWDAKHAQPSGAAQADVRNSALAINNQTLGLNLYSIVSAGAYDGSWAQQVMDGAAADAGAPANTFSSTVDMLSRYMNGAQISSASFETIAKGDLTQSPYYQADSGTSAKAWFDDLTGSPDDINKVDPSTNPLVSVRAGSGLQATGTDVRTFSSTPSGCTFSGTRIVNSDGSARACNLSPLSMYNYLNTDFGSTSMRMYSSSNVASEATRSVHNSVTQVGTGTMSFLYWFDAVVLLGSFVVIGFGYAFSLLFASIRRSFQIVSAAPLATVGALAAIAKIVVYSVALILEVVLTIFIYKMVQEFLTSLPQIIEMPFATVLNNGAGGATAGFVTFLLGGWGFSLVVTLLSIIGVVAFTVLALRVRKALVKAVEEAVTKLIEKFMDTPVGMPGGGLAPALAGGLASGAGAAAANHMMNKSGNKGAVAPSLPSTDNRPDAVTTAGGTSPMGPGPSGGQDGQLAIAGDIAGADGNGDPGTPMGALPPGGADSKAAADEEKLGRQVEAKGISSSDEIRSPQVGDDALSSASESLDKSTAGYKEADTKRLAAGKEGAEATGHAAIAAGRGMAGDTTGAAKSGGKALEHGGAAVAAGQEAKQREADAGRSSLDKPNQKNAQAAAKAQQVSKAGTAVSGAAGAASGKAPSRGTLGGANGGTAKRSAPHAPSRPATKPTQKPVQPAPKQSQQVPAAPKAPQPAMAPKAPRPAPRQAPAPEKRRSPRPAGKAPRPAASAGGHGSTEDDRSGR